MYERFFGLVDAPFRLTPDPRYLFLSRRHADALAHLKLGLTESSGFVCITGDVGTGKTTVLRAFLAGVGPDVTTAYVFNPALSPLELLQTVNAELGLSATTTSKKELVDELNLHLLEQRRTGRRSVVVIDEAQALGVEVLEQLRLLSNLETTTEKLLRIVLVGQPQLQQLLLHPELVQLNQRITLRWHMGPLTRSETAAYVRHRLQVASRAQSGRVFTRSALALVHRYSAGVPRLVNMVAHRAMVAAFARDERVVGRRTVQQAYREIVNVPLPARPKSPAWTAAWAAVGAGVCLGVIALGGRELAWRAAPPPPAEADAAAKAAPPPPADPAPGALADASSTPAPVAAPASAPEGTPRDASAPDPHPADAPAAEGPVLAALAPAVAVPEPSPAEPLATLAPLAKLDVEVTARTAVAAVLDTWRERRLDADESAHAADFTRIARARGLEYLPFSGNVTMLRLLDHPAVLELQLPDTAGPRYAALVGLTTDAVVLALPDGRATVSIALLDRVWLGQAHLLWRDFEGVGVGTLGPDARGPTVAHLQALLRRAGFYGGADTGVFDAATGQSVTAFQRSRLLDADGRVGRLTRVVLYAAAGGYPRPTLAGGAPS
jgi:general secretion pathway protein A